MQFLSSSPVLADFIKQRFKELFGLSFFVIGVLILGSLITYNPVDPSFNTASSLNATNLFKEWGSITSDIFLQAFGVSSFLWAAVFFVWGVRLLALTPFSLTLRHFIFALLGITGFSVMITALPFLDQWMIPIYKVLLSMPHSGGFMGYLMYAKIFHFIQKHHVEVLIVPFALTVFSVSFISLWFALGYTFRQLMTFLIFIYRALSIAVVFVGQMVYHSVGFVSNRLNHYVHGQSTTPFVQGSRNNDEALKSQLLDMPTHMVFETVDDNDLEEMMDPFDAHQSVPYYQVEQKDEQENSSSESFMDLIAKSAKKAMKKPTGKSSLEQHISVDHIMQAGSYLLPSLTLLDKTQAQKNHHGHESFFKEQALMLENVLNEFGVDGEIVNIRPGPVVTMFELKPAPGIKTSRVIGLADDIARSMSALSARIAVIPGQNVIGIELPNKNRQTVFFRDLLSTEDYENSPQALPLILGQNIGGQPIIADLSKMPHLLVAGTTGSGKSVSVNAMILSLLFKLPPTKCKFIMIDPKMLELSIYDDIPHLLTPVVTDPKKAVVALKWAVKEMESRYRSMSKLSVRNIDGFNKRLIEAKQNGESLVRRVQTGFDPETGKPIFENQGLDFEPLPYIVIVVDEMADLMLVAGKEIEATIQRLAQMARAAGIHLIMATQRPSVDVITGTIKANFPTRISFQVTSKIDSRTILSEQGAEQLLGQGDMLYMAGGGRISRVHGPFVRDDEVERIVAFLKSQGEPSYIEGVTDDEEESSSGGTDDGMEGGDPTYRAALEVIMREGKVSTSFIQRHLQIGYNRAARIVEQMEKEGIISAPNHAGKREILKSA